MALGISTFLVSCGNWSRRPKRSTSAKRCSARGRTRTEDRALRWDPFDDRRYAYRSDNPAASRAFPIYTVRGANRLAVEALRCFPTAPQGSRLATAGFAPLGPRLAEPAKVSLRWPTWRVFLGLATVKSLLVHPALWQDPLPTDGLSAMGVEEVFECQRRTEGYVRNFTSAYPLLARFESAAGSA